MIPTESSMFTRNEKIILIVLAILFVLFWAFPQLTNRDYELFYLIFIVVPLGILTLTDKERRSRLK